MTSMSMRLALAALLLTSACSNSILDEDYTAKADARASERLKALVALPLPEGRVERKALLDALLKAQVINEHEAFVLMGK